MQVKPETTNNMNTTDFYGIIEKLGVVTNGARVYFDPKTYDFQEDIPRITANGKEYVVEDMAISAEENGTRLDINYNDGSRTNILLNSENTNALEQLEGLEDLLRDFYYGSPVSYDIGDYEMDFLEEEEEYSGFLIGDYVKWNDPAIDDFNETERDFQRNRIFQIFNISGDIISIDDAYGEAEVFAHELELVTRAE